MTFNDIKNVHSENKLKSESTTKMEIDKNEYEKPYKVQLVWTNIIVFIYLHVGALYGVYLIFTSAKIATTIFAYFLVITTAMGITAGVHRLWSHRSYKAKLPLQLLLLFFNTTAFEMSVLRWAHDHRQHHKYSETDADPYNAKRGFIFAHIGWLCCRKHPLVIKKGQGVDVSDLYADPLLRFQKKYYYTLLMPLCCIILPTVTPVYFWNESWTNAFFIAVVWRWITIFHCSSLVNSAAHLYGNKPYEKNIYPSENRTVSVAAFGEGWHNYHHTFPWDYKTSELGNYSFNVTTAFIDFFAWIGWAYDLKTVSPDIIKKRVQRTGDGSHELWGWGDKKLTKEDHEATIITHEEVYFKNTDDFKKIES